MNYEVYFWHSDEHRSLLQGDTVILGVQPGIPKVRKIRSLHIFAISPWKHGGKVDFWSANKQKKFLWFDVSFWVCLARHAQNTQNNKGFAWPDMPKVPATISLQYLYNILRKTWRINLFFCLQINAKRFLQIAIIILGVCCQAYPNCPK